MSGADPSESPLLIEASAVIDAKAFDAEATEIGVVAELVLDRVTGATRYAVLALGGFLGIGTRRHPVPWSALSYDPGLGGYVVNVNPARLPGGPAYEHGAQSVWGSGWGQEIDDYYRPPAAPTAS